MTLPVHGLREGRTDSTAAQNHDVHDWNATRGPWGCALCVAFTHVGTFSDASKRVLFGRALHTNQLGETLLPKRIALPVFASAMWRAVLPLTLLTVSVLAWRAVRSTGRKELDA